MLVLASVADVPSPKFQRYDHVSANPVPLFGSVLKSLNVTVSPFVPLNVVVILATGAKFTKFAIDVVAVTVVVVPFAVMVPLVTILLFTIAFVSIAFCNVELVIVELVEVALVRKLLDTLLPVRVLPVVVVLFNVEDATFEELIVEVAIMLFVIALP